VEWTWDRALKIVAAGNLDGLSREECRFWKRVWPSVGGCWDWKGARTSAGYGQLQTRSGIPAYTHRMSYEMFRGPIPAGLHIDHLCRNRACCNPCHLEAVEPRVNLLRGKGMSARHAVATHCQRGHLKSPDNIYTNPKGARECRACRRINRRAFDEKRKSA
jgi:hypothetical protein